MHDHGGLVAGGQPPVKGLVLGEWGGGGAHMGRAVSKKLPKEDPRAERAMISWRRGTESGRLPMEGADRALYQLATTADWPNGLCISTGWNMALPSKIASVRNSCLFGKILPK